MPASRSLRILWLALVPVLVVPLYGQVSCNRTCPPAPNECLRSAGRSLETNQCVYTNLDGAECSDGGVAGTCSNGQCETVECAGAPAFAICDDPVDGDLVGACVEDLCIAAAPEDPCVRVGVGRINCCSNEGCSVANGAYCNDPEPDGTSCDPTGVEPPGQPGQDGICEEGTCVAQTGLCADVVCATSVNDPCARDFCDAATGQCDEWIVDTFTQCLIANAPGLCLGGVCEQTNGGECNGAPCGGGPCDVAACRLPCLYSPSGCSPEELQNPTYVCEVDRVPDGAPCIGTSGQCQGGTCLPVVPDCRDVPNACDDGNPCTEDRCLADLGLFCDHDPEPDGTSCAENTIGEVLALCENGVCLPDLCRERDCSDGNSCTQDLCEAPFGICTNPNEPNGTLCVNAGQCLNGICIPSSPQCFRDSQCDDGNSCTEDTCPAGACIFDPLPNGAPCIGENGQCLLGSCLGFGF